MQSDSLSLLNVVSRLVRNRSWFFAVIVCLALNTMTMSGFAQPRAGFGPGHEEEFARIFGKGTSLPEQCKWLGATVFENKAVGQYECPPFAKFSIEIHSQDSVLPYALATERFHILSLPENVAPRALLESIAERARAEERSTQRVNPSRMRPIHWYFVLGVLSVFGGTLAARRPRPLSNNPSKFALSPLVFIVPLVGMAVALWGAIHFRPAWDDFVLLVRARASPWHVDQSARFLSVSLHGRLGILSGHPNVWFASINILTLLGGGVALGTLVQRLSKSRNAGVLSCGWYLMGPGVLMQVRWFAGAQHLFANLFLFAALIVLDEILHSEYPREKPRTYGLFATLFGIGVLGSLSKFASFGIVVPSAIGWCLLRGEKRGVWRAIIAVTCLATTVLIAIGIARMQSGSDDLRRASIVAIANNLSVAFKGLARDLLAPATLLALSWVITLRRGSIRSIGRDLLWLVLAAAAGFGALFPFLLNADYFMPYYPVLCVAIMVAAVATLSAQRLEPLGSTWKWGFVSAVFVAVAVPLRTARDVVAATPENLLPTWLDAFSNTLHSVQPIPRHVRVTPRCESMKDTESTREELNGLESLADHSYGIRWVTGWDHLVVTVEGHELRNAEESTSPDVFMNYCSKSGFSWPKPTLP